MNHEGLHRGEGREKAQNAQKGNILRLLRFFAAMPSLGSLVEHGENRCESQWTALRATDLKEGLAVGRIP
jgi:hypothetical protein